jgi:hypothetical protein
MCIFPEESEVFGSYCIRRRHMYRPWQNIRSKKLANTNQCKTDQKFCRFGLVLQAVSYCKQITQPRCRQHHLLTFIIVVNFKNIIIISFKKIVTGHFSDIRILISWVICNMLHTNWYLCVVPKHVYQVRIRNLNPPGLSK